MGIYDKDYIVNDPKSSDDYQKAMPAAAKNERDEFLKSEEKWQRRIVQWIVLFSLLFFLAAISAALIVWFVS